MDSIAAEMRAYPGVQWRYLFLQYDGAHGLDEINFDPSITWPLQLNGRA
jgi:hypothetical protein